MLLILFVCVFCVFSSKAGLVLGLSFNENSGLIAKDVSPFKNDATLKTGSTVWSSGKFGNAIYFNGTSSLSIPNSSSLDISSTEKFTFSAWLKPDDSSSNGRTIISKAFNTTGAYPWYQYAVIHYSGGIVFYIANSSSAFICNGPKITTAAWTHLTVTHDGSNVRFYVNSTLAKTVAVATSFVSKPNPFLIGDDGAGPYGFFKGFIDEMRVYDEVITSAKITSDYSTPLVAPETVPPTLPVNFVISSTTNSVSLKWDNSTDNEGVAGYEISRSVNNGLSYSVLAFTANSDYTDPSLLANTFYYYKVRAKDVNGNFSDYADIVAATLTMPIPLPPQPISISFVLNSISNNVIPISEIDGATLYASNKTYAKFTSVSFLKYPWQNAAFSVFNPEETFYYIKIKALNSLESDSSNTILVNSP